MSQTRTMTLTPPQAVALIQPVLPGASAAEVLVRTGGQLSTVFEVRCPDPARAVIVKVYDEQWRWKQDKEIYVYRLLAHHRVGLVPTVLHSAPDGGPLNRAYTVMTLLEGRPLSEVGAELAAEDMRDIYRRIGVTLASIHDIRQDAYGYLTTRVLEPMPDNASYMRRQFDKKLAEYAELGGDPQLHRDIARYVTERAALFEHCFTPVLCHNDLHEGNVLVARQADGWRPTGFVDVENAVAADPLLDLAKTDYYAIRGDTAKWTALLEGYGPLLQDSAERLALYRLYHALELWDWFASLGESGPLPSIAEDLRLVVS